MFSVYNPGQARILFDVWPDEAEWFVIGGPANANEAQTIKQSYPNMKCVGFEPNISMLNAQRMLKFPGDLHQIALWKEDTTLDLKIPNGRDISSSLNRDKDFKKECTKKQVPARTLDTLEKEYGPWDNIVLWLDIEDSEYEALQGAKRLFNEGKVLLCNVEIFYREKQQPILQYMEEHCMRRLKTWNTRVMPGMIEVIFGKDAWY